jgi:hypothetical protein
VAVLLASCEHILSTYIAVQVYAYIG